MPVRRNVKCVKRRQVHSLIRDGKPTFLGRKFRPLVESCLFCSNQSNEGAGHWICASCIENMNPPLDSPLWLALFGLDIGIDIWLDGHWVLTGMLVEKHRLKMHSRKKRKWWQW